MNEITYLPYIISNNTITITYNRTPYYILKEIDGVLNVQYNTIKELLKESKFNEIINVLIPKKKIIKYITDYLIITNTIQIYMRDDMKSVIPDLLSERIFTFFEEGLPIEPLINFWKLLRSNPNEVSKKSLYRFLDSNKHTITSKGNFIGYKSVNYDLKDEYTQNLILRYGYNIKDIPEKERELLKLTDVYSSTFNNSIGTNVSINRDKVDIDINRTCSNGLHVASYDYAKNHYRGNVVVEVLINPFNVVAVPYDYNNQKMRVCEYKVLGFVLLDDDINLIKGKYDNYREI